MPSWESVLFRHHAGWNGVGLFIGTLLAIALLVALRLSKLPALPGNAKP